MTHQEKIPLTTTLDPPPIPTPAEPPPKEDTHQGRDKNITADCHEIETENEVEDDIPLQINAIDTVIPNNILTGVTPDPEDKPLLFDCDNYGI